MQKMNTGRKDQTRFNPRIHPMNLKVFNVYRSRMSGLNLVCSFRPGFDFYIQPLENSGIGFLENIRFNIILLVEF